MFLEFDEILDKLQPGSSRTVHRVAETTDTSWDESNACAWTKEVLAKKTKKNKMLEHPTTLRTFCDRADRSSGKAKSFLSPDL